MSIINGYIMQKYEETEEFHLYKVKLNDDTGKISLVDKIPLCSGGYISYDVNSNYHSCGFKTESEMAKFCGEQPSYMRHKICANCVGHFYKTN